MSVQPPAANSTGLTYTDANGNVINKSLSLVRAAKDGNLESVYEFLRGVIEEFNGGEPKTFIATIRETPARTHDLRDAGPPCAPRSATLIDANPGTLHYADLPIGIPSTYRSWP